MTSRKVCLYPSSDQRCWGNSSNQDFKPEINWTSADVGSDNTFYIKLVDANGQELTKAAYDVMLFKGEHHLDQTYRANQTSAVQKYKFEE